MNAAKILRASRLRYLLPAISDPVMLTGIYARIEELLAENPTASRTLRSHLISGIIPAIASYESLRTRHGDERAFALVRDAVIEYAGEYGRGLIALSKTPVFFGLLKFFLPAFLNSLYPPEGWVFTWIQTPKDSIGFDAHSCFYVDMFAKYNVFELTKIFCETDDVCYRKFKFAVWQRTKTIGRGDDLCDFRFYKRR